MSTHGMQVGSRVQIVTLLTETSPDVRAMVGREATVTKFQDAAPEAGYKGNSVTMVPFVMVEVDGDREGVERGFMPTELLMVEG